ncbi:NUDIX domain-containing protein [Streptomyces sp. NBC_00090]|uniref:NUDIX domain-containing protein n=1 Tax=Streptomyces sp. NBC_00090 TaxID=2903619 RepID=UPI00324A0A62
MSTTSSAHTWNEYCASGRGIKPLSDTEIHVVRERLPDDLRHICLDDCEIDLLMNGWGWEPPAGRVEPGEAFEDAAVRELEEETGLLAVPGSVVLLGTLCDDSHGMTRVTEVARLTDDDGETRPAEPDLISRWEWHTPADLRTLPQSLFTASAQALNTVWPGLLRHVFSAHLTPRTAPAGSGRLRFGEPPTAVRLRERLAEDLTEAGFTGAPRLQAAFEVVPCQAFLTEQPLRRAYVNEAIATVTAEDGGSLSSPRVRHPTHRHILGG